MIDKKTVEIKECKISFDEYLLANIDAVMISNNKGKIVRWNGIAEKMFGWNKEEMLGELGYEKLLPNFIIDSIQDDLICFKKGGNCKLIGQRIESSVTNKKGNLFFIELTTIPVELENEFYLISTFRNITNQKIDVDTLKLAEAKYKEIKYAINQSAIVATTDVHGTITYVNDKFCEISQYSEQELLGKNHRILNSDFHSKEFFTELWKTIANGRVWNGEIRNKSKNGSFYWVNTTIVPFLNRKGKPYQYMAIRFDITERKKVEKERLHFELQLSDKVSLLASIESIQTEFIKSEDKASTFSLMLSNLLAFTHSEYGFIGEVLYRDNKPYMKTHAITDISWDETSRKLYEKCKEQGLEFSNLNTLYGNVLSTGKALISNNPKTDKRRGGVPNGHPPLNRFLGVPVKRGEKLIGIIGVSNRPDDYTEEMIDSLSPFLNTCGNLIEALRLEELREKTQLQLTKTVRDLKDANDVLDSFVYRVSHDLKSPAINIASMIKMLKDANGFSGDSFLEKIIENMDVSVNRMQQIIENLLELSKIEKQKGGEKTMVQLHTACGVVQSTFANQLSDLKVDAQIDFSQCGEIYFSETELNSVFQNFLTNSIKYRNKDKRLQIIVRSEKQEKYDVIYYTDNGIGMDLEKLGHKLFGMFERLHPSIDVEGTGVGLHIVKKLIENAGGKIDVKSKVGVGTTFIVYLPQKLK